MALFTDSDVVTLDDLLLFENSLVQVSSNHGIDVQAKIKLATDEIGDKLMLNLLRAGQSDPQWLYRSQIGLSTVVVTNSLFRWLCFNSLARFFAEAYNVQLNTRFQGKWNEYQQQSAAACEVLLASGVGIVFDPLPKPTIPKIVVENGSFQGSTIFLQVAWVDGCGHESAPSPINGTILNGSTDVKVYVADNPTAPTKAVGWNLYASTTQQKLTLQNSTFLPVTSFWQVPVGGLTIGKKPSNGQAPDTTVEFVRRWQRG